MPKLDWINDENLNNAVSLLLEIAKKAKENATTKFGKNVIDPFSALFEISGFGIGYNEWIISETARQAQKTLQNHIGDFHQKILGACKGWKNLNTGGIIDIVSDERKIIAEVKNKFHTIKGANLSDLYNSMSDLVLPKSSIYKGYTAYYAVIIPKRPVRYDKEFVPSDNKKGEKCPPNKSIREIDGVSFYSLVTGKPNALQELFDVLPTVISDITGKDQIAKDKLTIFFKKAYEQKISKKN